MRLKTRRNIAKLHANIGIIPWIKWRQRRPNRDICPRSLRSQSGKHREAYPRRHIVVILPRPKTATRTPGTRFWESYRGIHLLRELYKENKRGNRNVGYLAGASMCRKISEGNPRCFTKIMGALFEEARKEPLDFRCQQRAIERYCHSFLHSSASLPEFGLVLFQLLSLVQSRLHKATHSEFLTDVGYDFYVPSHTLASPVVLGAIELGIAYSHICVSSGEINLREPAIHLRLAHAHAAAAWIPMRNGGNRSMVSLTNTLLGKISDNNFLYEEMTRNAFSGNEAQLRLGGL